MAQLQLREALRRAMVEEMRRDDRVLLMGEEVAWYDGAYKVSQGMLKEFGERRVVDTPIAENGFCGLAIGAAMSGLRPIVEVMTWNFSLVAYDQIVNNAAKMFQMTAGSYRVPIVFRGPTGAAENLGSQHSQALESIYAHFPGLKVVSTATPSDAYGLLKSAIRDDNPVCFMESELSYGVKGEVPDEEYLIPLGKADVKRPGTDVTLVTWNKAVFLCLEAAAELEKVGISARVLDLRSIRPLDEELLYRCAVETHRMVVVQEGFAFAGTGAEIAARVQEACFDELDAPVLRVTNRDVNQPYATNLEKLVVPSVPRVVDAVRAVTGEELMAQFYELPAISPTMEIGTIVEWKLAEGASFESGAVLAVIGTDKANMDAEIFDAGVLIKRLAAEGDELPPGFPIAIWGKGKDEDVTALLAEFEKRRSARAAAPAAVAPTAPPTPPAPEPLAAAPAEAPPARRSPAPSAGLTRSWRGKPLPTDFLEPPGDVRFGAPSARPKASPLARKLAAERGVSLGRLRGTGPGGRIVVADLDGAPSGRARPAVPRADESKRNSPMRKTIAKRLLASHQGVPSFFLTVAFDGAGFVSLRESLKKAEPDLRFSYNDLLLLCVAHALRRHPEVNASWADDAIVRHGRVDIGVAVALPDGLITPVVRNADALSLAEVGALVKELAGRAREQRLEPDEYTGSTFTISNLGMMGIEHFTAIINPPESAILAVGALEQVPVVTGGVLGIGWRMHCTMTCDHRVVDGATGAAFLATLRRFVECPALLWVS